MGGEAIPPDTPVQFETWLILETESGLWWKTNANGYTQHIFEAGLFTEADAKKKADNPSRHDKAIPLTDYTHRILRLYNALKLEVGGGSALLPETEKADG